MNKMKSLLIFLSLFIFNIGICFTTDIKNSADAGDYVCQFIVGRAYEQGDGVRQNYEEALKWYEFSAHQDYAPAQNNLGSLYDRGLGTEKNYQEALKWYRKAADNDQPNAQYNLGRLYEYGLGVDINWRKAAYWYQRANDQGIPLLPHQIRD